MNRFNQTYNDNELHLVEHDVIRYFDAFDKPKQMGCFNVQITRNSLTETMTETEI